MQHSLKKYFPLAVVAVLLDGCATLPPPQFCPGTTKLPPALKKQFEPVEDVTLLHKALGQPGHGKLCAGRVYRSRRGSEVVLYRAWNSTNPASEAGHWWTFQLPKGQVAQYRSDYEICYQWSPLDKLDRCSLKANVKLVVGPGQSTVCSSCPSRRAENASCPKPVTYPASPTQQVFIENAREALSHCATFDGKFNWQAVKAAHP